MYDLGHHQELTGTVLNCLSPQADPQLCPTFLAVSSPHKALQQVNVFAVTHKLSNHFLVQPRVLSQPLGYLCVVHWDGEETFLLQKLDPLLWFLVELLCASNQQLEKKYKRCQKLLCP